MPPKTSGVDPKSKAPSNFKTSPKEALFGGKGPVGTNTDPKSFPLRHTRGPSGGGGDIGIPRKGGRK